MFDPLGLNKKKIKDLTIFQKTNVFVTGLFIVLLGLWFAITWGILMGNAFRTLYIGVLRLFGGQ